MPDLARLRAWCIIVATCAAVLTPLVPEWRGRNGDSFPLSWYPMFAKERPALEKPTYVYGRTQAGERRKIDVSWWTSGGFNQGRNMLTKTVAAGEEPTRAFCEKLAKKVVKKKGEEWAAVTHVVIARAKFDRERFFALNDREPLGERVVYACGVPR